MGSWRRITAAVYESRITTIRGPARPVELITDGTHATLKCGTATFTLVLLPDQPDLSTALLVPARVLGDTARALTSGAEVSISLGGDSLIGFAGAGRQTTTRLLSGEYPKYSALLPSESSSTAIDDIQFLENSAARRSRKTWARPLPTSGCRSRTCAALPGRGFFRITGGQPVATRGAPAVRHTGPRPGRISPVRSKRPAVLRKHGFSPVSTAPMTTTVLR